MILTPHAMVGAAIANIFPGNPVLGFSLAFASHYLLDLIPHKEYAVDEIIDKETQSFKGVLNNLKARFVLLFVATDVIVGIIICFGLFSRNYYSFLITLLGFIGGVLPDIFQIFYYKYKRNPWVVLQKIHNLVHSSYKMKERHIIGTLTQVASVCFFVFLYFYIR